MKLAANKFNTEGYWTCPLVNYQPIISDLDLFDQNGYDLTALEQRYSQVNSTPVHRHRAHRTAIKSPWFTQEPVGVGAHLNHSLLFERKAYHGLAREQLVSWAVELPLLHKLLAMRAKWGLDFSMDYVDHAGNTFELLHWEWDSFDYSQVEAVRARVEPVLLAIDWEDAAHALLARKDEWHHLDFFAQSDYKCRYFGVPKEQFKMVLWN